MLLRNNSKVKNKKLNCWEFQKCGREPNGAKVDELGACLASTETRLNGVNNGINGGRACWALTGTLCEGEVQGTFALKLGDCMKCDFHALVFNEEYPNYKGLREIIDILKT